MVHPDIELRFINETVGHGLVARRLIPRGTITWARDRLDRTFTSAEIEAMPEFFQQILDKYTFIDRTAKAPSVEKDAGKVFWYTVRAVQDTACGPLTSPDCAPARGIRSRVRAWRRAVCSPG